MDAFPTQPALRAALFRFFERSPLHLPARHLLLLRLRDLLQATLATQLAGLHSLPGLQDAQRQWTLSSARAWAQYDSKVRRDKAGAPGAAPEVRWLGLEEFNALLRSLDAGEAPAPVGAEQAGRREPANYRALVPCPERLRGLRFVHFHMMSWYRFFKGLQRYPASGAYGLVTPTQRAAWAAQLARWEAWSTVAVPPEVLAAQQGVPPVLLQLLHACPPAMRKLMQTRRHLSHPNDWGTLSDLQHGVLCLFLHPGLIFSAENEQRAMHLAFPGAAAAPPNSVAYQSQRLELRHAFMRTTLSASFVAMVEGGVVYAGGEPVQAQKLLVGWSCDGDAARFGVTRRDMRAGGAGAPPAAPLAPTHSAGSDAVDAFAADPAAAVQAAAAASLALEQEAATAAAAAAPLLAAATAARAAAANAAARAAAAAAAAAMPDQDDRQPDGAADAAMAAAGGSGSDDDAFDAPTFTTYPCNHAFVSSWLTPQLGNITGTILRLCAAGEGILYGGLAECALGHSQHSLGRPVHPSYLERRTKDADFRIKCMLSESPTLVAELAQHGWRKEGACFFVPILWRTGRAKLRVSRFRNAHFPRLYIEVCGTFVGATQCPSPWTPAPTYATSLAC